MYRKKGCHVIDSAIYEENGKYYLFVVSDKNPRRIILLKSDRITGPFSRVTSFNESMETLEGKPYEAPTAIRLEDGKWYLFLDYFGVPGAGQGYIPFMAESLASGRFQRVDEAFSFPYRFKHGTILRISMDDYERIHDCFS